jgi:hypothetical protein
MFPRRWCPETYQIYLSPSLPIKGYSHSGVLDWIVFLKFSSKEHSGCPLSEIPMGQIRGIYDRPNLYRPLTKYDSLLDLMDRMGPQASRGLVWVVRVTIFPTLWTWENQYVGSNNTLNLHQYRKKPWRINMALQWYNILKVIYIQPIIREKEKSSQAGSLSRPIRRLSMASMK